MLDREKKISEPITFFTSLDCPCVRYVRYVPINNAVWISAWVSWAEQTPMIASTVRTHSTCMQQYNSLMQGRVKGLINGARSPTGKYVRAYAHNQQRPLPFWHAQSLTCVLATALVVHYKTGNKSLVDTRDPAKNPAVCAMHLYLCVCLVII